MLIRVGIVATLAVFGLAAYQVGTRKQVSRVARKAHGENGTSNGLLSRLRPGVPCVVYFWSPDCAPCLSVQKPALELLQKELGEDGLQVLAINVYEQPEVASEWGVLSLPTTFIVDAAGTPRGINNGVVRADKLRRQIVSLA